MDELSVFVDGRKIGARFHVSHRISGAGHGLERLHGHTYEIMVRLSGKGDATFLYPFEDMMDIMMECADVLDNKTLLASAGGNVIKFEKDSVTYASADDRRYVLPKEDVVILPMAEVTAEALANYLIGEICAKIRASAAKSDSIASAELTLWEGNERGVVVRSTL